MRVVLSRVGTAAVLLGLGLAGVFTASPARADGPGPWARTEPRTTVGNTLTGLLIPIVALPAPHRWSFCGDGGSHCLDKASIVWDDIRAAAEEFYDRSAACTFTSFVGYEWSGTPLGNNLHRNVIF